MSDYRLLTLRIEYNATEFSNSPSPPRDIPLECDQIDTGLAGIALDPLVDNGNTELRLITDQEFPETDTYKSFRFDVTIKDSTRDAYALIIASDWAGNCSSDTIALPGFEMETDTNVWDFGKAKPGGQIQRSRIVINGSFAPSTVRSITIRNGENFRIAPEVPDEGVEIASGGQLRLNGTYLGTTETTDIETDFDVDTIDVVFDRGSLVIPVRGVTAEAIIQTNDIDFGQVAPGDSNCASIFTIFNTGTDTLVITGIEGINGTTFTIEEGALDALPYSILPQQSWSVGRVCFKPANSEPDKIDVIIRTQGLANGKSSSTWRGNGIVSVEEYPAPPPSFVAIVSNDVIEIDPGSLVANEVQLLDLKGKVLLTQRVEQAGKITMPIHALAQGVYVVVLRTQSGVVSSTVSVTR